MKVRRGDVQRHGGAYDQPASWPIWKPSCRSHSAQAPLYRPLEKREAGAPPSTRGECATAIARAQAGRERGDLLAGMAMEENLLKVRLADLQAERPTLTALYAALTPDQKHRTRPAARHKMEGRMHMMMGMMDRIAVPA